MNQVISRLNYEQLMFADFEMASAQETIEEGTELFDVFRYKKRNKETEELPSVEETINLYKKEAALSPIYGKIISGCLGIVDKGEIKLKSFYGEEKQVVKDLTDTMVKSNRILVGYNIKNFDLPYNRKRYMILGLGLYPETLNDIGKKPWDNENKVLDIMQLWKSNSIYNDSLEEMCLAFNIPNPKSGSVKGSEVSKAYHEGRIEEIVKYGEADVKATINLFRVLKGDKIIG